MTLALPKLSELSETDRQVVQTWLAEFERYWDEGRLAAVGRLLPAEGPLRLLTLVELVKIDLKRRWQRGLRVSVESYLMFYPELGTSETVAPELVQAEYDMRRQCGVSASREEFARRFPRQIDRLLPTVAGDDSATAAGSMPLQETACAAPLEDQSTASGSGAPSAATVLNPLEPFGRYRLIKQIGEGGMGTVYLAQDSQLKRQVALKIPHFTQSNAPKVLARFYREAQAAATLAHPNICPVYDVGECNGLPYLTMAFIEGKPLSASIKEGGPLPLRQAAERVQRIALALEEAHQKGIVHRDLKPSNIMINQRDEPVIMDFGLARLYNDESARITQSGVPLGTPSYMSPEQVAGEVEAIGPACDIYSLGVILYELVTGRVPFKGAVGKVLASVLTEEPAPPSRYRADLDPRLEAICGKAMAKNAAARYASMSDLAAALTEYLGAEKESPTQRAGAVGKQKTHGELRLEGTPETVLAGAFHTAETLMPADNVVTAPPEPATAPRRRQRSRAPLIAGGLALVAAASIVALAVVWSRKDTVTPVTPVVTPTPPVAVKEKKTVDPPALPPAGMILLELGDLGDEVEVRVDGKQVAHVSLGEALRLPAGRHRLRIAGKEIEPIEREFSVEPGYNSALTVEPVYFGLVRLALADPAAELEVRVDGAPVAKATWGEPLRLKVGEHRLQAAGKDMDPIDQIFTVKRGDRTVPIKPVFFGSIRFELDEPRAVLKVQIDDGPPLAAGAWDKPQRLSVGKHRLQVTGKDIDTIDQEFAVERGDNRPIPIRPDYYGTLTVELSDPAAAVEIAIDDQPLSGDRRSGPFRLRVGPHQLRVSGNKYKPFQESFRIEPGSHALRRVPLERKDSQEKNFRNSIGMDLVLIPEGKFLMGSPQSEAERLEEESPHAATIAQPFYMATRETTVGAFRAFVRAAGYKTDAEQDGQGAWRWSEAQKQLVRDPACNWQTPGWEQDDGFPVACVSWNDAKAFCKWLSGKEGKTYRLPTEEEWEYACRAHGKTPFHFGATLSADQANFDGRFPYGAGQAGTPLGRAAKAGSYPPNAFGLHDMHGNVWEWCEDLYRKDYTKKAENPAGAGKSRNLRGGSWFEKGNLCRSAYRSFEAPDRGYPYIGFRVVQETFP